MLGDIAESYLRVLVESNVEEANEVLKSYVYNRINFRRTGKKRSWGSAISNPSKGLKNLQFQIAVLMVGHSTNLNILILFKK